MFNGHKPKRQSVLEAFRQYINTPEVWERFQAAFSNRLKHHSKAPSDEKKFLGALDKFCIPDKWNDWYVKPAAPVAPTSYSFDD